MPPIDAEFLDEMRRFELVLKRRVHSKYQGGRESRVIGSGLIFRDHSAYSPGDDIRRIDWRVYARTEKLFIKRFEEERNMTIHIVLDSSASMDFGKKIKKFDYGAMIGMAFAFLADRNNEKFEFTTFSDSLNVLKPRYGKRPLINILEQVNSIKIGGKSKLKESLETYKQQYIRSKSLLVLISDFWYDPNDIKEILLRYKHSDVYLVQVIDPLERDLTLRGDVLLEDLESHFSLRTFISNRFRDRYKKLLHEHVMELQDLANRNRATFITATTDEPVFDAIFRMLFRAQETKRLENISG